MLHKNPSDCSLCKESGGKIIYKNSLYHIVLVNDKDYPCFIRLILNKHINELSDLPKEDANVIFNALYNIEKTMRFIVNPDKVNIASLGNLVPHLHWHIIPRFVNDKHFPNPIWGEIVNHNYKPSTELTLKKEALQTSINMFFDMNDGMS